ncbi:NB-ARC domain-containing protein [Coleofasciculus sp. FACHB-SPT9]|uniref:NB-ARC domain-containing protein n=1 Tax=Cyanophyceae TaxID=3028117 RepID=UPI0030D9C6F5
MKSPERERVKSNPPQNIPYRGVANFVGRTDELETLHRELRRGNRLCSISGMGGVGKTELATQYAQQHEADYPGGICWLPARESNLANGIVQFFLLRMEQEVLKEFKEIRSELNLQKQVEWCWQHWEPSEGLVLVVLDDVTDLGSCREILPTVKRFHVLVTTRQRHLDSNVFELPLDVLSLKEAFELLTTLEGEGRMQQEPETAEELCKWLGCLPLGLELVGRYLKKDPDLSLAEMLERLEAQRLQDEALDPSEQQMQQTFSTAARGVRAAFELSWRELAPISQLVGQLLSLFKPTVIPWELVTFSSDTQLLNWANTDIKLAKQQLYSLYLIQRLEEREACYEIHHLIREFLQYKVAASEQANARKATFLLAIKAYYQKLAGEMLEQNLNEIEERLAEEFEQLEFSERWRHPREMDRLVDFDEITVTVDSVKIIKKSIIDNIDDEYSQFKYELSSEIVFTPDGSYLDLDMCYRDPDDGELVFLNTITEVGEQQTGIVTAKVDIAFDANDPLDANEVEVEFVELVDAPTEVKIEPVDIKMSFDFEE